ncbi:GlxA family transcriptional regulator [Pseudovibrio sp. Tun.PSC04-5.I4]|uniref:GlxA family transcriptional regulator n=1 Tax=Pseudovibrio sp. Tun.PSC04-5.I4 TaxID=1798213 RepID=UPI000B897962|nr:GlxA family transcriptional regulator [Pseudovibrio sp. Tun.PSC04-5.I4]
MRPQSLSRKAECKLKVAMVLLPNFTLLALSCLTEVLRHAADDGDESRQVNCSWDLLSVSTNPIMSSSGITVTPNKTLECDLTGYDYIVIIGGKLPKDCLYPDAYIQFIKSCRQQGNKLIGMCTGTFALARAGILKNVRTALHWYHYQEFRSHFPSSIAVTDELYIEDRNIITCAGGAASSDLALYLVEKHLGKGKVIKCLRHLILISAREARQSQTPFDLDIPQFSDVRLRKAVFLMEQNLEDTLEITQLANTLSLSQRQLNRLFLEHTGMSPSAYYRSLRLRHARWLLDNSEQPLDHIALGCGFSDLSHLTRYYKKQYKQTPGSTRSLRKKAQAELEPEQSGSLAEFMHE